MSEAIQMWWRAHAIARLLSRARQLPGSPAGGSEGVRRG